LDEIGLEGQRVEMINLSSAMGNQFAVSAQEMCEQIVNLGPNPLRELNSDN
jgi:coenzyme F420-reducing hydrogenase delta subunit